MAKLKLQRMTTPAGTAVWPWLNTPDTKFKPEGEYRVGVSLPRSAPGVAEFMSTLEAAFDAAQTPVGNNQLLDVKGKIKRADVPWKDELDEKDQPTGNVVLNLKMRAKIQKKEGGVVVKEWDQRPDLFDAKLAPLDAQKVRVGGGSTVRVNFEVMPFYTKLVGAGISLRMRAVQILNLVEFQRGTGASYGFGEEDGFAATEAPNSEAVPASAAPNSTGAEPDF
jgi:hypothetical protein